MKLYTSLSNKKNNELLSLLFLVIFFLIMPISSHAAEMSDYVRLAPVTDNILGPVAVAVDKAGRLYVAESSANRIGIFSQSGKYITKLIDLDTPISLEVDAAGRIYVGSKNKGSVEVYDADFSFLFKLGNRDGEFAQPNDICVDTASGWIYVVDKGNDIVRIYDAAGRSVGSFGSPGNGNGQLHHPVSITIDKAAGEIIVLDLQLAVDSQEGARIQFFDMTGNYKRGFSRYNEVQGDMVRPQQITVDKKSRIYVTDSFQNVVLVYDNAGNSLGAVYDLATPMLIPLGIVLSETNRLYVASRGAKSIEVYGLDSYSNMAVDPVKLSFTARDGGDNPASQGIKIHNNGNTAFKWSAVANDGWLSFSSEKGALEYGQTAIVNVAVDITGFGPGEHTGSIMVSSGAGITEMVQVVLTVTPSAKLLAIPSTVSFASEVGTTPFPEKISISNTGSAPLNWSISADQEWVSVSEASGTISVGGPVRYVTVLADVTSLGAGVYTGTITVTGKDAQDSPALIDVTLTLTDPASPPPQTPSSGTTWLGNFGRKWTVVSQLDGTSLNGIWGSSGSDIIAIGDSGTVLHYDGRKWAEDDTGTSLNLYGVWGSSASSIYAVGESGLVLYYDGESWSDASPSSFTGTLRNVWCITQSNCLAVGQNASIQVRSNATGPWSLEYSLEYFGSLRGIWGSSDSDIYAVGDFGTILHYNGTGWEFIDSETYINLYDVWGSAADNVFVVGQNGTILHYNGTLWAPMESGTTVTLNGIWGNAANEVYTVGEDGTMLLLKGFQWDKLEIGIAENLNDVWSDKRKEVYAVGSDGSIIFGRVSFPWQILMPALSHNGKQMQHPAE